MSGFTEFIFVAALFLASTSAAAVPVPNVHRIGKFQLLPDQLETTPQPSPEPSSDFSVNPLGLTTNTIIAIAIGLGALVIIVVFIALCCCCCRRR